MVSSGGLGCMVNTSKACLRMRCKAGFPLRIENVPSPTSSQGLLRSGVTASCNRPWCLKPARCLHAQFGAALGRSSRSSVPRQITLQRPISRVSSDRSLTDITTTITQYGCNTGGFLDVIWDCSAPWSRNFRVSPGKRSGIPAKDFRLRLMAASVARLDSLKSP
ncbi:hypothetical protein LZ31DRAFT_355503 [Colletotrichum somersetense]|nr:hypothetical protein LZ31DRAFT_355503 [Colletotrichum somersetense]